jgi:quinoprotein glucose dehydrogenase
MTPNRWCCQIAPIIVPIVLSLSCGAAATTQAVWSVYGGDQAGTRYSAADQINTANVGELRREWIYRTGDAVRRDAALMKHIKFEVTPILVGDKLIACTAFNEIIAIDPGTGRELWRFDPKVATDRRPANRYNCRGVAQSRDLASSGDAPCTVRILSGTTDARLIAVDARDGHRCASFGVAGEVKLDTGDLRWPGEFQITSAPVVAGNVVIVGSAISDNGRVDAPSGKVRAFDVRTGRPLWSWDPIPRDAADPASTTWGDGWRETGAANVWAPMSIDEKRRLVFLPTSSPSPDFFGGLRPGANRHADSVVALHIADGTLAWAFQITKHDVWDYDLPAQPTLTTLTVTGATRDVVIQGTKQGFVFVLDRDTGVPVFPVEERAVPQGGAPGEALSPTQTFPADMPSLVPQMLRPGDAFGFTPYDRNACRQLIASLRSEGIYTPPTTQGSVVFPFTGGGVNWGGVAVDPQGVVYVNTSRAAHIITLIARADFDRVKALEPGKEISPQTGAPFGVRRDLLASPFGAPCNPPPWGAISAIDLHSRRILWEARLGTTEDLNPFGIARQTGTPNFGGPMATAGGLVFIGAAMDRYLRAFDQRTGTELWSGRLPSAGMATPMTYVWKGRQYVVVAAGGHGEAGAQTGDSIVAFALAGPGQSGRSWWDRSIDQPGGRFEAGAAVTLFVATGLMAWIIVRRHRRRRQA